jgi:hypothetical protein
MVTGREMHPVGSLERAQLSNQRNIERLMVRFSTEQVQEQRNGKGTAELESPTDQQVSKDPLKCKGTRATLDVIVMCVRRAY